jgi:hypothetical protein
MTKSARAAGFGTCILVVLLQMSCSPADCVSGPLCGDTPSPTGTGSVSGRVQIEGADAAGVVVALSSEAAATVTATTSTTGEYIFAAVPLGSYTVSISDITSDATCPTASYILTVGATGLTLTRDFDCAYLRTASISGIVTVGGQRILRFPVALSGESSASSETNQLTAVFTFGLLRLGEYTLTLPSEHSFLAGGHLITAGAAFASLTQQVTLTTGQALSIEFAGVLPVAGTISGTVMAEGEALPGATVQLTTGPSSPQTATTADDGTPQAVAVGN